MPQSPTLYRGDNPFNDLLENFGLPQVTDARAQGAGFNYAGPYQPGNPDSSIQQAEAFAANEMRDAGTGSFRGLRRSIQATADQVNLQRDVTSARDSARRAAKTNAGQFERATRTLDMSDRQKKAGARKLSLNRAVSEAAATSQVRRTSSENARQAMRAGLDLENMNFSQMVAGLSGLANAEGQKRVRVAQEQANDKASRNSWIQTGIGAVVSLAPLLFASSEGWKDKREENPDLLKKLKGVRVDKWNYKGEGQEHIGPYAEEFNNTFGTSQADPRFINVVDIVGVALGAVKQLDAKVEALTNAK